MCFRLLVICVLSGFLCLMKVGVFVVCVCVVIVIFFESGFKLLVYRGSFAVVR